MRADEVEEEEMLCAVWAFDGGWVVRALDDRRGDIARRAVAVTRMALTTDQKSEVVSTARLRTVRLPTAST